jgi:membrane protease subunit HflC
MKANSVLLGIAIVFAAIAFIAASAFSVSPAQQALVLQFGEAKRVITEPGLNFKVPFVQNVVLIDKRVLDVDTAAEEVIASDQKRLVVDAFARFKITDPLKYYQTVGTEMLARSRLQTYLNSSLRRVLGAQSFFAVLSGERANLMHQIRELVNQEAKALGIEVIDVRIRRADLPEANSQAVYRRMQTEREREAREARAQGAEAAQRIRSRADREVTVLLAEARRDADILRGTGDAERARIFAEAYNRDPAFYAFSRSMIAYERSIKSTDTLILSPESDFFRYFVSQDGAKAGRK